MARTNVQRNIKTAVNIADIIGNKILDGIAYLGVCAFDSVRYISFPYGCPKRSLKLDSCSVKITANTGPGLEDIAKLGITEIDENRVAPGTPYKAERKITRNPIRHYRQKIEISIDPANVDTAKQQIKEFLSGYIKS